jgi:glycogen(starch) synthase
MRILLLSNLFPPDVLGGYELLAADVADGLRRRGHDVVVLTSGAPRESDPPWVQRHLSLVRPFHEPGQLDRVRHVRAAHSQARALDALDALGAQRFDVALAMSLRRLGLHLPRELAKRGIPTVYCFNDDWLLAHRPGQGHTPLRRAIWTALERGPLGAHTFQGAPIERAVYVSASIRDALRDGGAPVPEGVVRFQGVDLQRFPARPFRPVGGAPRLLFAGRLHATKGCDRALHALASLRATGVPATLTIAGDGAERAALQSLSETLGLTGAVTFLGLVPRIELARIYREHDVFLFPSLWQEPAGLTYLEAMASGVPVVGLARGGAGELLVHDENALVAEDAETLAEGVRRLVASPALAERIVSGGLDTVRTRASLEGYVGAIESELFGACGTAAA